MEVAALVPAEQHVCTRYRVAQFAAPLRAAGIDVTIEQLARSPLERFNQLRRPRGRVLLVRKLLPGWQLALLRRSAEWLAFDFDDAVFHRDTFNGDPHGSGTRRRRFGLTMRWANRVFAGNAYLAAEAERRGAAGKVAVAPTCIDPNRYPAGVPPQGPPRLVWIGASRTLHYLEQSREIFSAIGAAAPGATLRVVCDRFPELPGVTVEPVPWSAATEAQALGECAIGVAPLTADPWSQGKCGLKLLQYMASGLAVVASPVGVQREMLEGGAGVLAETPAEWAAAIAGLLADPARRAALGAAARARVAERYSVAAWAPRMAQRFSAGEVARCA